jgi:hypothetical protein
MNSDVPLHMEVSIDLSSGLKMYETLLQASDWRDIVWTVWTVNSMNQLAQHPRPARFTPPATERKP